MWLVGLFGFLILWGCSAIPCDKTRRPSLIPCLQWRHSAIRPLLRTLLPLIEQSSMCFQPQQTWMNQKHVSWETGHAHMLSRTETAPASAAPNQSLNTFLPNCFQTVIFISTAKDALLWYIICSLFKLAAVLLFIRIIVISLSIHSFWPVFPFAHSAAHSHCIHWQF